MRPAALLAVLLPLLATAARGASDPYLVRDINPMAEAVDSGLDHFSPLAGGRAAFSADDGFSGNELWGSDGTAAGTVLLADTCPGECSGFPRPFALFGGPGAESAVYAAFDEGREGPHLWWTDGTPGGTVRITAAPVRPGSLGSWNAWVAGPGLFFFTLHDPVVGEEIWVSDRTPGGARLEPEMKCYANPGPKPMNHLLLPRYTASLNPTV